MEKYKKVIQKKNKFKISAPTWNEEFESPDQSCSVSDILSISSKSMRQLLIIPQ